MIPLIVEAAPFDFGWPELLFTSIATGIVLAILGPRWWAQRKKG